MLLWLAMGSRRIVDHVLGVEDGFRGLLLEPKDDVVDYATMHCSTVQTAPNHRPRPTQTDRTAGWWESSHVFLQENHRLGAGGLR